MSWHFLRRLLASFVSVSDIALMAVASLEYHEALQTELQLTNVQCQPQLLRQGVGNAQIH